jgi:hypothetical protein
MQVDTMDCGDKIYALDVVDNLAVVGTKDKRVLVWDVRSMKAPQQVRESPLKVCFDVSYIIQFISSIKLAALNASRLVRPLSSLQLKGVSRWNILIWMRKCKKER